jgi:hypothetical protein
MKNNRERWRELDSDAMSNWIRDRSRRLGAAIGGELESVLNAETAALGEALHDADCSYSNDAVVSILMQFLIENAAGDIQAVLKQAWIGKSEEQERPPSARAYHSREGYEGYLVVINAELEYRLARVSELYSAYLLLNKVTHAESSVTAKLLLDLLDVVGGAAPLSLQAFETLSETSRATFDRQAGDLYLWGTAFVVGHEMGHHALLHTSGPSATAGMGPHQKELDADSFAVRLMLGAAAKSNGYSGHPITLLAGPLVAMTSIALSRQDGTQAGSTHPSLQSRWRNTFATMEPLVSELEHSATSALFGTINNYLQSRLKLWTSEWWL